MINRSRSFPLPDDLRAALAPHFPDHDLCRVLIHQSIPWHVRRFARVAPEAYTSGNHIYFAPGKYDPSSVEGIATIAHELTHSQQYKKYGRFRFRLRYLKYYFENKRKRMDDYNAYEQIPFEREAYDKEREIIEYLKARGGRGVLQ